MLQLNPLLRYESQPLGSNKRVERDVIPPAPSGDSGRLRLPRGRSGSSSTLASRLSQQILLSLPTSSNSTTRAGADACISALLSLAVVKSRGPFPAGGIDCSTLRSTEGLNGASFCAKRG